ncbi:MAG: GNAT family N-acetyltransferase [Solirubrobacterales bacterium]
MSDRDDRLSVAVLTAIDEVDAASWDACADSANPFVAHAFLAALERSGSATAETGWLPRHLVARDGTGKVVACAPLYLKTHSYGEYVFDWGWAEAYARAGGRYYPKLQCAIPFTPVTGPRLMAADAHHRALLALAMIEVARTHKASSVHVTFAGDDDAAVLDEAGYMRRLGFQYHWENHGYRTFEDFLASLASRRRKQIRKEREAVTGQGIDISTLVGADVKARHWDAFHRFYSQVVDRKWGAAYLNRAFFEELSASRLADQVVLVWAEDDGRPLAAAFNMVGGDTLFGRTWGARREVPFLHFEACFYRALDFAIAHGLSRVEAGAQGEHKLGRGYLPTPTHSAHWIADPALAQAVARFLAHERRDIAEEMAAQADQGPYRRPDA